MDQYSGSASNDDTEVTGDCPDPPQVHIETSCFDDHPLLGGYPGARGVMIDARRNVMGPHVDAASFPTVWILDSDEVEMDDVGRWPAKDFVAWIDAIRAHITSRRTEDRPEA